MRDSIKRQQSNGIAWVDQEAYEQLEEQLAEAREELAEAVHEHERDEDIKMAEGLNTSLSIALDAAEAKVRHLEARLEAALHALHNIAEDEWQGSIWHREGITADTYAVWRARVELESQDASDEGE